jgi:hypothetical protein
MSLNLQSYVNYINSLEQPQAVVIDQFVSENKVTFFEPLVQEPNWKFANALTDLCNAIQQATDEPAVDMDAVLDEMDEEFLAEGDDILADVIAEAVEATTAQLPAPEPSLMEFIRKQLLTENPWQILEDHFGRITSSPLASDALILLLDDARTLPQAEAEYKRMVQRVLVAARNALDEYNRIEAEASAKKQRARHERGTRPVDIYHTYAKVLRHLAEQNYLHARRILRELMLENTMPLATLDTPYFIDQYTGEVDPEADDDRIKVKGPVSEEELAAASSESFNDEDGLDEEFFDEWDIRDPQFMEMQQDMQPTAELYELRKEAKPYQDACRFEIDCIVKELRNELIDLVLGEASTDKRFQDIDAMTLRRAVEMMVDYPKNQNWPSIRNLAFALFKNFGEEIGPMKMSLAETVCLRFRQTEEAKSYIRFLNHKAQTGAAPQDIFVLFFALQHAYGFLEEDAERIQLPGQYPTLADFAEEWGDFVLECMNDKAPRHIESDLVLIEKICANTMEQLLQQGDPNAKDITHTPAYLKGYYEAMFNARTVTFTDKDGYHNLAQEAGWDEWRAQTCPQGNQAYKKARADGKPQKEAMKAFWSLHNSSIARIRPSGLVLKGGREIGWNIAVMKLKAGEFPHTKEDFRRLLNILTEKKIGQPFAQALQNAVA